MGLQLFWIDVKVAWVIIKKLKLKKIKLTKKRAARAHMKYLTFLLVC